MKRVSSRQRLVSWDLFDADTKSDNEDSHNDDDEMIESVQLYEKNKTDPCTVTPNLHSSSFLTEGFMDPTRNPISAIHKMIGYEMGTRAPVALSPSDSKHDGLMLFDDDSHCNKIVDVEEEPLQLHTILNGPTPYSTAVGYKRERHGLIKTLWNNDCMSHIDMARSTEGSSVLFGVRDSVLSSVSSLNKASSVCALSQSTSKTARKPQYPKSPPTLQLTSLIQDVQYTIVSFLNIQDILSLGNTCTYFRSLLRKPPLLHDESLLYIQRNAIWMNIMIQLWPFIQQTDVPWNQYTFFCTVPTTNLHQQQHKGFHHLPPSKEPTTHTSSQHSSYDPTYTQEENIDYAVLLLHAMHPLPTHMDLPSSSLSTSSPPLRSTVSSFPHLVSENGEMSSSLLNLNHHSMQSQFIQYTMNISTMTTASWHIHNQQKLPVIQFVSQVGQGNRCIRSNIPFPSPRFYTKKYFSSVEDENLSSSFYFQENRFIHGSNSKNYNTEKKKDIQSKSKSSLPKENHTLPPLFSFFKLWRSTTSPRIIGIPPQQQHYTTSDIAYEPFVCPHVANTLQSKISIDVSPRLVYYYEVSILHRDIHQEPIVLHDSHFIHSVSTSRGYYSSSHDSFSSASSSSSSSKRECIAIGWVDSSFPTHHLMPGWDIHSYGYHSDDGGIFHCRGDMIRAYGPTFGVGDTVGCGINYSNGGIFYTLNGQFLGYAWIQEENLCSISRKRKEWYPCVGVDSNHPLYCNFGHEIPFHFDLSSFLCTESL